jgi:hypothetical protein
VSSAASASLGSRYQRTQQHQRYLGERPLLGVALSVRAHPHGVSAADPSARAQHTRRQRHSLTDPQAALVLASAVLLAAALKAAGRRRSADGAREAFETRRPQRSHARRLEARAHQELVRRRRRRAHVRGERHQLVHGAAAVAPSGVLRAAVREAPQQLRASRAAVKLSHGQTRRNAAPCELANPS